MPPSVPADTPALDQLRPGERAAVLDELLRRHPELRPEADQVAMELLRGVSTHQVAEDVAACLMGLELDALAARAGRVPGGYVHETEAASELVEESLAPIEADLRRCIELDLGPEAEHTLLGLVTGLYRCADPPDGTVLAYAGPDTPSEHAHWLVTQARCADIELDADDLEQHCPGWRLTPPGPARIVSSPDLMRRAHS